ncbi:MAG TPA: NAD(P)/FAD-dependent oxidoreductase [Actinomycetes bacterium]|nr:NAD(P)/FAD-dependent oxidoreductase [Actinomycetes bacterium]
MSQADVVVIGGGHNGLVCACYLARAGLDVVVLEAAATPGGCIHTVDLPDGRGRLEVGAYEHGGIRGSGVAADLELEARFGLRFHLRDQVTLAPCDDGTALAFHASLEQTVECLRSVVGDRDAEAYRRFAGWAEAGVALLRQTEDGPPPSLRELAALAEAALGPQAGRLLQALLGSAADLLRSVVADERLQGPMAHWAAHSQQSPADPGTGAGALLLAGGHGRPAARPAGGSRSTVDALVRCLEAAGGRLRCGLPVTRVEVAAGRALAVHAGGERVAAARAVVSAVDARRLLLGLVDRDAVPPWLLAEAERIHVGRRNVSELKVDAVLEGMPAVPGPPGFERSFMLSANTTTDLERAFASIQLGQLPERPPLMLAFPSTLERGWAPPGRAALWLSTFVPWRLAAGPWDQGKLERAADHAWRVAEKALGAPLEPVERRLTGPVEWVARHGSPHANPNHVEMSIDQLLSFRPSPSLSGYRTPIGGLFLTGAGTHPGGGVTGLPGRNAAAVVLDALGAGRRDRSRRLGRRLAMVRDAGRALRTLRAGGPEG